MKILVIDTAHGVCSIALGENGEIIAQIKDHESSRQAERLIGYIEEILTKNACSYDDIGAIAVNIGPGSFTGIRIGVATARGIGLARNIPVFGVSSLEAMAFKFLNNERKNNIFSVLDARRGQVFLQGFSYDMQPLFDPMMVELSELSKHIQSSEVIITGDGIKNLSNSEVFSHKIDDFNTSDALYIYMVSNWRLQLKTKQHEASPLYIRKPDAKPSKQHPHLT